jgi:hypothetical protein
MAIDFPNSPSTNDIYSAAGKSWVYDGTSWNLRSITAGPGSITSTEIANGTIVNADVASNAAIATTKITGWEDDQVIITTAVFL